MPRFTVRLLMAAVLLVAVALAGFEAGRRWEHAHRLRPQPPAIRTIDISNWQLFTAEDDIPPR